MPSLHDLRAAGRVDLLGAVNKQPSVQAVAERVGLTYLERKKPKDYWSRPGNLARELKQFMTEYNCQGLMPTEQALLEAGRGDLVGAITRQGGVGAVAVRLGLIVRRGKKAPSYWTDPANIDHEVRAFILRYGSPGVMPSGTDMERAGRTDLLGAIRRHGGLTAVAVRLGLSSAPKRVMRPWPEFAVLEAALRNFCQEQGLDGQMPTSRHLIAAGRRDLVRGIVKFGGFGAVAERLGLARAGHARRK